MTSPLSEQMARRVRVAAGPHDNPDMSVQQVVSAMASRIAELERLLLQVHTAQKLHYGDGMGLHLEMIGLAQHIDAALSQPKVDA